MPSPQSSTSFMQAGYAAGRGSAAVAAPCAQPVLLAPPSPWRLPVASGVLAYQTLAGATLAAWLLMGQRTGVAVAAIVCAIPLLLTAWLVLRADSDDRQFIAKLFAAAMFGPLLLAFWAGDQASPVDAPVWPCMLGMALLHLAALVAAVLGLGAYVTRVAPVAGVAAMDGRVLRERLLSLAAAQVPVTIDTARSDGGASARLVLHLRLPDPARSHRVSLHFDRASARVRVFERTGAQAARPLTDGESSMRGAGDAAFDPTRPDAQYIAGTTWQTTMVAPQRLAAFRLALQGPQAMLAPSQARALDAEGVVTLLCAVVTGAGWTWQPAWRE